MKIISYLQKFFVIDESSPSGLKYKSSGLTAGVLVINRRETERVRTSQYWFLSKARMNCHKAVYLLFYNSDIQEGMQIDHIDGNTMNNKISNLRLVTRSQNQMNRKVSKASKTGHKGVTVDVLKSGKCRYNAVITANKRTRHLGRFKTLQEAVNAYQIAAKVYHREFANV